MTKIKVFKGWYDDLKNGKNVEANFRRLMRFSHVFSRKFHVRILLAMVRKTRRNRLAVHCAKEAADLLLLSLNKPALALAAYEKTASLSEGNIQSYLTAIDVCQTINKQQKALTLCELGLGLVEEKHQETLRFIKKRILAWEIKIADGSDDVVVTIDPIVQDLPNNFITEILMTLDEVRSALENEENKGSKQELREKIADTVAENSSDRDAANACLERLMPSILCDHKLRDEIVYSLRGCERYEILVDFIRSCLAHGEMAESRFLQFELGAALRLGLGDPVLAASVFSQIIESDSSDREAWGELLECLAESGDYIKLVKALNARIELAFGIEKSQLEKRRDEAMKKIELAANYA